MCVLGKKEGTDVGDDENADDSERDDGRTRVQVQVVGISQFILEKHMNSGTFYSSYDVFSSVPTNRRNMFFKNIGVYTPWSQ